MIQQPPDPVAEGLAYQHDRPDLPAYDQDLWNDRLHTDDEEPQALLRLFEPLRASTIDLMFRMLAGHDRIHLAQARRALDAVRG